MSDIADFIELTREIYETDEFIPLHEPRFAGNESKYLLETIESTFVSSVGEFVDKFEEEVANYTKVEKAVAVVNGTSALQVALRLVGVYQDTEVITQALTFVATANAIVYNNAKPIFLDVDRNTLGLCPTALDNFLENNAERREEGAFNKLTGKKISAILPMHTFGFMCEIEKIIEIADRWKIPVVEDSAESFGSSFNERHSGTFGSFGVFSFNGNKLITSGGGGAIVSNKRELSEKAKYLTNTAKKPHSWEYFHDELGYNFRMPNLNAALALAQFESVDKLIASKKKVFSAYEKEINSNSFSLKRIPKATKWNYWLFALEFKEEEYRKDFLEETNAKGVMTRPIWELMYKLPMYEDCFRDDQTNAEFLASSIINIPSSAKKY